MSKNILVISSSPREHGNSDMLSDAFIQGAKRAGHTVNKYKSAFTKISGCRACNTCWRVGVPCSFNDDFNEIFAPLLEQADALVISSPMYFFGFPASVQATLEKMYSYLSPQSPVKLKITKSALLISGYDKEPNLYNGAIQSYKQIHKFMGWEHRGIVIAPGFIKIGTIAGTNYLEEAKALGKNL